MNSAAQYTKIPKEWIEYIKEPKSSVTVKFPVELRNNEIKTIKGVRVIHSDHMLPTKGGLRFSIDTSQADLEGLASLTSYKAALHDIPFGGARGCIYIDPSKYTFEEKVQIIRRFTLEMWKRSMIKPSTDVINPDIGTDEKIMNVIKETYKIMGGRNDVNLDAVVTGKGVLFGGIGVSKEAAGYGIAHVANYVLNNMENKIISKTRLDSGGSKKSVIIQGFGQVGFNVSKFLVRNDFKIVGLTDNGTGCFNPAGFDPVEIYSYKKMNGGLHGISRTLNKPEEIHSQKCDLLILSEGDMTITKPLAETIKCKILIEACNAPCTKDALDVFYRNNIVVIPDILSNSGAFIVSYLEWLKNLEHKNLTLLFKRFDSNSRKNLLSMLSTSDIGGSKIVDYSGPTEDELVLMTIEEIIDNSFKKILNTSEDFKIDLKTAAFKLAIENIYNKYNNFGVL